MSKGDRRERLERILKDAEPALDQPSGNGKTVDIGDIAGQANQVVVGNDNIVITNTRHRTKAHPLRSATRLLWMGLIVLCMPLLFCVERTRPPAIVVTVPITAIAPDQAPTYQPAAQMTPQTGFHVHAGCSFFKPLQRTDPVIASNSQSI